MLKWVQCVRRRPDLTAVEFRRHFRGYGEELLALGAELGAVRVELSAVPAEGAHPGWPLGCGSSVPFDGLAEVHFAGSAPEFFEALERPGTKARAERLLTLQENFADIPHSCSFLASQEVEVSFPPACA